MSDKPLIVEPNLEVILEVRSSLFEEARSEISVFCHLVKSPFFFYTYLIDQISLWNGFSNGLDDKKILASLEKFSKYEIPHKVIKFVEMIYRGFGIFRLENFDSEKNLFLYKDKDLLEEIMKLKQISSLIDSHSHEDKLFIPIALKNILKTEVAKLGYTISDFSDFIDGDPIEISLQKPFELREYQKEAINSFLDNTVMYKGGTGTVLMPCGSGKTILGIGVMEKLKMSTLIITPNLVSLRQWKRELLEKTTIKEEEIGEYSSLTKEIKAITLTTYQIITYRENEKSNFKHLKIFKKRNWGLIIYDEIHMLPADIFKYSTGIESKRKLGLTATLVREDGREKEVFTLVGPKKYDLPWKQLESINYIAKVRCFEIKVAMNSLTERLYYTSENERNRYRIAAENPDKLIWVNKILAEFKDSPVIIIGQYVNQLQQISQKLNVPLLTGQTKYPERLDVYNQFKQGKIKVLMVSKIANFAVDLPNAEVAIQISGSFGSRQEETQRLGRIVRPKKKDRNNAYFFTLITKNSREEFLAQNRKGFLMDQGYQYKIIKDQTNFSENIFNEI